MTTRGFTSHFVLLFSFLLCTKSYSQNKKTSALYRINLAGRWDLALDTGKIGIKDNHPVVSCNDHVILPGTLAENKKGFVNYDTTNTGRLSSAYLFEGWAWYQKQVIIPPSWKGRSALLYMERTKPSKVWVDGVFIGASDNLMTSQQYELPVLLTPGKHNIVILVDNSGRTVPGAVQASHAWTDNTQTNWNGVIGKFFIQSLNKVQIRDLQTYPDIKQKKVGVHISLYNSTKDFINSELKLNVASTDASVSRFPGKVFKVALKPGVNQFVFDYYLGNKMQLWSEFTPVVYNLRAELLKVTSPEERITSFGMRSSQTKGTHFLINDLTTFLRGNVDNCIFPLTGYPPMEVAGWRREFRIAKSYGINHFRFHSFTPPEAAFEAADLEGIYMQVELPFWGTVDKKYTVLNTFLLREGDNILREFGSHPSFVMFSSGNELTGDTTLMKVWLNNFKLKDNRHLYAFGSNIYIGEKGYIPGEDFTVTMQVGINRDTAFTTPVRGSFSYADMRKGGAINALYPSLNKNYENAISKCPIPVIGHEVGQYEVYPNFDEISKYTGILKPINLEIFRKRLNMTGMGPLDEDFSRASGALSVICYKAEIEMALRTRGFGGFQLLDLQDYPGQGTALVGILDAFMDSKGLITPENFRKFNNAVVPLLVTEKYCWKNDEHLTGAIQVSNYGSVLLNNQTVEWKLTDARQQIISQGKTHKDIKQGELVDVDSLNINLSNVHSAQKLSLTIALPGTDYKNSYNLWVYPANVDVSVPHGVEVRSSLDSISIKAIENGANVVLFPQKKDIIDRSVAGLFTTDFWNYAMFNGADRPKDKLSPGTMGILTNPNHPLFKYFPTDFHTDWQWWSIINSSNPLILDKTAEDYRPIVQVVDNINRNHKLGLIFEFALGKGKLLICMSDLRTIDKPEAKQLYSSLLAYVVSDQFHPGQKITADDLMALLY